MQSLPDHLTHIVVLIRHVIRLLTPPVPARDPREQMFYLLNNRVGRCARLFLRLYELWRANRLPAPRPARRTARAPHAPNPPAAIPDTTVRAVPHPPPVIPPIPRRKGWFVNAGQHHAGLAHHHLSQFIARPDLPEFLAAVPLAGRYLRPLCRLLHVPQPAFLALPPRPRRRRPARPATPRPRAPNLRNPQLPPGDPPFRPYVLAAARYFRKKYGEDW